MTQPTTVSAAGPPSGNRTRGSRTRAPLALRPHDLSDLAWPSHSAALGELAILLDLDGSGDQPQSTLSDRSTLAVPEPRTPADVVDIGTLSSHESLQPSDAPDRLPPATRLTA